MKYLLDSLQSYENGHGDALHPVPSGFNESFTGEHIEALPVTAREVRELKRSFDEKIDYMDQNLDKKIDQIVNRITSSFSATYLQAPARPSMIPSSPIFRYNREHPIVRAAPYPCPPLQFPSDGSSSESETVALEPSGNIKPPMQERRIVPIQGVVIPNLKAGPDAWKEAVRQWEEGDTSVSLIALKDWPAAWFTGEMRTLTGSKRRDRELVAIAYNKSV